MTLRPDASNLMQAVCWPVTPLGPLWGEVREGKLATLHWGEMRGALDVTLRTPLVHLMLDSYFKKNIYITDFNSFHVQGTPFQKKVWKALCDIPFGTTVTYGELAAKVASSPRAVGRAVGANPLPILIPCHRVVGAKGELTGFSAPGGLATKEWLLRHEGVLA